MSSDIFITVANHYLFTGEIDVYEHILARSRQESEEGSNPPPRSSGT